MRRFASLEELDSVGPGKLNHSVSEYTSFRKGFTSTERQQEQSISPATARGRQRSLFHFSSVNKLELKLICWKSGSKLNTYF